MTLNPERRRECGKIVCTSTVLLNGSLDGLLEQTSGCLEFVIIGLSAGCVPDPLFARGVTGVGGTWLIDPARALDRAAKGEPWGDTSRKFMLRKDSSYPGLDDRLRRATR